MGAHRLTPNLTGDIVADVETGATIGQKARKRAALWALLAFYDQLMGPDIPFGDPSKWQGKYAWRCWYLSLDLLIYRHLIYRDIDLRSSTAVSRDHAINRQQVWQIRYDGGPARGKDWTFQPWESVEPYLRVFLGDEADLALWQTLHSAAFEFYEAAEASGKLLPIRRERIDKMSGQPPRPSARRLPLRSEELRRQVDASDEEIGTARQAAESGSVVPPPPTPETLELEASTPTGDRPRSTRWWRLVAVAAVFVVLGGGVTFAVADLTSSSSACSQPPVSQTTNRFPGSYTGPVYITVCAATNSPETVSMRLVWGAKHRVVQLTHVTDHGRSVTMTKGTGSWPLTVMMRPSARIAWGTGIVPGALDINAGWTRTGR